MYINKGMNPTSYTLNSILHSSCMIQNNKNCSETCLVWSFSVGTTQSCGVYWESSHGGGGGGGGGGGRLL